MTPDLGPDESTPSLEEIADATRLAASDANALARVLAERQEVKDALRGFGSAVGSAVLEAGQAVGPVLLRAVLEAGMASAMGSMK